MSNKKKYTQLEEEIIREFLTKRIAQTFIAYDTEQEAINSIIDMYVFAKKRDILSKAIEYKIQDIDNSKSN